MLKNFITGTLLQTKNFTSVLGSLFHTSQSVNAVTWLDYNKKKYPPQKPDEPRRPAYICHCRENIKYSYKKLLYIAWLVRGMSVDEAIKQLSFIQKKGAVEIKETILEAQKKAVSEHDVEYKSNLWVSESFVGKGMTIKGLRRCARKRMATIKYRYTHYFVTLEEGTPPEHYYYYKRPKTQEEMLKEWLDEMRGRKVTNSL